MRVNKLIAAYRVSDHTFDDGSSLLLIAYGVEVDFPPSSTVSVSEEHSDARWMTFDEALEYGSHIVRETVNALRG